LGGDILIEVTTGTNAAVTTIVAVHVIQLLVAVIVQVHAATHVANHEEFTLTIQVFVDAQVISGEGLSSAQL
jgi:hypothetical protein